MNRKDRRAAEKGSNTPSAPAGETERLFALALKCHQTGKMSDAEGMYRHILASNPRHVDAQHLLGVLALQSGRPQIAVEMIGKAIALNSRVASFHSNLAEALRMLGRLDEAAGHLQQALILDPNSVEAWLNLGNVNRIKGHLDESIENYRQALKLKPDFGDAHLNLGVSLMDRDELALATRHLRRALQLKPRAAEAFANLAIALAADSKFDEAIAHYRQSLALRPKHPETIANLGNALLGQGKVEDAHAQYAVALGLYAQRAGGYDPELDPVDALWMALQGKRPIAFAEENGLMSFVRIACSSAPVAEWRRICDRAARVNGLSPAARYELLVRRAIGQWIAFDDRLATTINEAAALAVPITAPLGKNVTNSRAYAEFLGALDAHVRMHPDLHTVPSGQPELAVIGDSHCLSYHGAAAVLDGKTHIGSARLVMGAKAWHLSDEPENQYKWMFRNAVASVPDGTPVVLAFGEIDCRVDEGILPFYRKAGGDLELLVGGQVERYVHHVDAVTRPRGLPLLFLSVPAPNVAALRAHMQASGSGIQATDGDIDLLVRIIRTFNAALAEAATTRGHRFLDAFALSAGPDGRAHGRAHVDVFHLKPDVLGQLLP